jgi:hypothetical protein
MTQGKNKWQSKLVVEPLAQSFVSPLVCLSQHVLPAQITLGRNRFTSSL